MEINYEELERNIRIIKSPELKDLVNSSTNKKFPIHRWYDFKEGFSSTIVKKFLIEFKIKNEDIVLDPFMGYGTTPLTCQQNNINSIGIEINPFLKFVSEVKTKVEYDINALESSIYKILNTTIKPTLEPPKLSIIQKIFNPDILNQLLMYKELIYNVDDEDVKKFLFLALASILEDASFTKKDGNGLRFVPSKNIQSPKKLLSKKLKEMYYDIIGKGWFSTIRTKTPLLYENDARNLDEIIKKSNIDAIDLAFFSPPYCNCFDYTEVYKIELWMLDFVKNYNDVKELRKKTLRSHTTTRWKNTNLLSLNELNIIVEEILKRKLWDKNIPDMIRGYFDDMFLVLSKLYEILKQGSYCAIVVGNSAYGGVIIPTDLLLSIIGKEIGFKPKEIRVARFLRTSSQQMKQLNHSSNKKYLRESVIILQK